MSIGKAKEGVRIIVGEALKGCVREWKEVSSRLMYVRMKVGMDKYVTVGAYGPGSERKKEERRNFCNICESIAQKINECCKTGQYIYIYI